MTLPRSRVHLSRRAVCLLALALFAIATAARFALPDPANGVGFLYLVPICVMATEIGWRGGVAASFLASVLVVVWAASADIALSSLGYASRFVTFASVGLLVGALADQRRRHAAESDRWFSLSNGLLAVADQNGRFTRVNPAWTETLGYPAEELAGRPFLDFVHPDDAERTIAATRALAGRDTELVDFENRYRAADGSWRCLLWSARSDGDNIYAVAKDITERKRSEHARLHSATVLALTDELTGVPNRRAWDDEVPREIARANRSGAPLSVLMLDLDGLKRLNDTRGHRAGSEAIRRSADAWCEILRATDFLARFGGDEFGALLPGSTVDEAAMVAERLRASLDGLAVTVSIGVAQWRAGESADDVVERADEALYAAKRAGRDRVATERGSLASAPA